MPLTIKGGPYSSNKIDESREFPACKPTKSFTEDETKTISSKGNSSNKINNHTTQKEIMKDLEINSYRDVMLKEPDKERGLEPMKERSILSDHVRYVTHIKSEASKSLA